MSILDNLPHTATVKIRSRTRAAVGTRDSYATVSTLSCWRQPAGEKEIEEFAKRGVSVTNKVYFTSDPGIDERHALEIGGETYEVRSFSDPDASAGLGIVYKVFVERTTTGSTLD